MSTHGRRDETPTERQDRRFTDILQELRVMQTGAQLIAGFLLILPFQGGFGDLSDFQRVVYLVLVALAIAITAVVLAPVAIHRWLSGRHAKERVVAAAARFVATALVLIGVLLVGIVVLVFDVVLGRGGALVAGGAALLSVATLLAVLPWHLVNQGSHGERP